MSDRARVAEEMARMGREYGQELAAALVLASSRNAGDRGLKTHMAWLVLQQIDAAVERLRKAGLPTDLGDVYQHGARQGVHDELVESGAVAADTYRRAA